MRYQITKGQRYDQGGARVTFGSLSVAYKADGSRDYGSIVPAEHEAEVEAAVRRVIETGVAETVEIAERPRGSGPAPVIDPAIAGCTLWTLEQGCPLHGETCNPAYR